MHREIQRASCDLDEREAHTISFQISNGVGRFTCCVMAHAPSRERAVELFEYNWHRIEQAAREYLTHPSFNGNEVRLVMA
jgi:hypothetical protein